MQAIADRPVDVQKARDADPARVETNIAACQFKLGEEKNAAQAFICAYEIDHVNPKAIANKAFGLLLQDDWPALKEFAETHLSKYPDNASLAAYYIQGMRRGNNIDDPLLHVPEAVRGTPEVLEARVRWLVDKGEHGAWWNAAIAAHEKYPDNEALKGIYADAVLDKLIGGASIQHGRTFSASERADIDTAIDIYKLRWDQIRKNAHDMRSESIAVPLNLMLAYSMLRQHDKSCEIGEAALTRFPNHPEVKTYMAAALMESGEFKQTTNLLNELEVDSKTVMMRFNIYMADNNWFAVSEIIDTHLDIFPEEERNLALAAKVRVNMELSPSERRHTILKAEQGNFQGDTRALIMLAQAARIHRFEDLASTFFKAGHEALECGDNGFPSRIMLAQEASERGEHAITADILVGHLDLDQDSRVLRLLAEALVHDLPIRARAVDFFEDLSPEVQCLPYFQIAEGVLHFNRGAFQDAIAPFTSVFEKERSADNLIYLLSAYFNVGNREAIEKLLQSNNLNTLSGSPLARLKLCQVFLDFDMSQDVLDMGYQALIDGLNDAEVVKMFLGLIFKATQNNTDVFEDSVVSGVWVRMISKTGNAYEVLLDEDTDRPWGGKADSSNTFYKKAIGLKTGDEFTHVNIATGLSETWTISEINPRWLQAFHHISKNFSQWFPDVRGFASVPMPDGDVEPVLEMVRHTSEEWRTMANHYLVKNLPLAFVASNIHGGSIAFAGYLVSIGEDVRVCIGLEDEGNEALGLIETNNRSGTVLDALTAWCAASLDVLSILETQLGPLSIPANEFSYIQSMFDDFNGENDREMMTLTYHNGKYIGQNITPEDHAIQRDLVRSRIETIKEICTVEPVVIPDNLTDAGEQFMESPFSDAVSPAVITGQDRLFLCQDMAMRQLARSVFDTKCVWIQVVLRSALQDGTMTLDDYSDALVHLANSRQGFVPVSAQVLLSVFVREKSDDLVQIQALCNYLGGENAEPASHIMVAAQFINTLWLDYLIDDSKVRTATQIVLDALLNRDSEQQAQHVTGLITVLNDPPKEYFVEWCHENGVPIDSIA